MATLGLGSFRSAFIPTLAARVAVARASGGYRKAHKVGLCNEVRINAVDLWRDMVVANVQSSNHEAHVRSSGTRVDLPQSRAGTYARARLITERYDRVTPRC